MRGLAAPPLRRWRRSPRRRTRSSASSAARASRCCTTSSSCRSTQLLIAGVAGLASRAFPALKGALLTNPTNLSVATIVSSLGGDGDASVVALAAVTAATKARARRMSISAVEFAKRNATPHKKKPSAMHAHAE